jgi:hypothetical protein
MTCDELLRLVTDYRDGALPADLCDELRRHLGECRPCTELEQDFLDLARLCRECPPPRLPEGLRVRLLTIIASRDRTD